jgi:hypothetical protein
MKLIKLVNSTTALGKLLKLELEVKKAYQLSKFIIKVDELLKPYNKVREELVIKYAEGGNSVKEENIPKFLSDLSEITKEEIEIEIPEITIDDISGKIETEVLLQLDYLIK